MRWYVSRNGETVGPVEESQVAQWVREGMVEAHVQPESGGAWTPIGASPFAVHARRSAKKGRGWLWAIVIVGGALFTCGGLAALGSAMSKRDAGKGASATAQLPWIGLMQGNCGRYRAAPNEIKKSAIFRENEQLIEESSLSNVTGKLAVLSTDQGGDTLTLHVRVGEAIFKTGPFTSPIAKGSPIYETATDMREGDCVVFSAEKLRAASLVEQSKVCDLDFMVNITDLRTCN